MFINPPCLSSGTKEKVVIDILTHRSSAQRQLICQAYEEATGRVSRCPPAVHDQSVHGLLTKNEQ